jgi:hypothetical protein
MDDRDEIERARVRYQNKLDKHAAQAAPLLCAILTHVLSPEDVEWYSKS